MIPVTVFSIEIALPSQMLITLSPENNLILSGETIRGIVSGMGKGNVKQEKKIGALKGSCKIKPVRKIST